MLLPEQAAVVGEVEAQAVRRDQRAGLAHALAQHLAQRRVQQVGRGVVALRSPGAARGRPRSCDPHVPRELPLLHLDEVEDDARAVLLGVDHPGARRRPRAARRCRPPGRPTRRRRPSGRARPRPPARRRASETRSGAPSFQVARRTTSARRSSSVRVVALEAVSASSAWPRTTSRSAAMRFCTSCGRLARPLALLLERLLEAGLVDARSAPPRRSRGSPRAAGRRCRRAGRPSRRAASRAALGRRPLDLLLHLARAVGHGREELLLLGPDGARPTPGAVAASSG